MNIYASLFSRSILLAAVFTFVLLPASIQNAYSEWNAEEDAEYMRRFHERFPKISSPLSIKEYADPKRYDELYMGERIEDELAQLSNDQGGISWGWSYRMMSLNEMYRATGDVKYLSTNLSIIKKILSVRDDRIGRSLWTGETAPAWGSDKYAERGRAIFAVHTGMILYPMYECLQLAKEQPNLSASFKEKFQTIL